MGLCPAMIGLMGVTLDHMEGISLNPASRDALYRQIYRQIVARIDDGTYRDGQRLPPTRALAKALSTHRNTVVRAFADLARAGYVRSVVGRGTFVVGTAPVKNTHHVGQLPWGSLVSRATESEALGRVDRYRRGAVRRGSADVVNLTRMEPPDALLPDALIRRCVSHVLRELGPRALGYAPREGLLRLRSHVSNRLGERGLAVTPDDILITTGSQQAIDIIGRCLVNPGDTFLVDASTYGGAINVLATAGARIVGVPSDAEGPEMASLERLCRGAKGLYLMPDCHNPTGTTVSRQRRHELSSWSHRAGVPIIEDDYGADLNLDGDAFIPSLRSINEEVIYVGSFSKTLAPALRVGFVVCPREIRHRLIQLKHTMDLGTSALLQHSLSEFLERGYMRTHLARVLPEYRLRRDALEAALKAHLPPTFRWHHPSRGVVLWLELPGHFPPDVVFEEARRDGVLVTPGSVHGINDVSRAGLRLAYCNEPPERLQEGAQRLGRTLTRLSELWSTGDAANESLAIGVV